MLINKRMKQFELASYKTILYQIIFTSIYDLGQKELKSSAPPQDLDLGG